MGRLDGKKAVVTGGTSGIGAGTARMFAAEGADIVFTGRSVEKGTTIEKEIREAGGPAHFVSCDLRKKKDVERLYEFTHEKIGKPNVLFNCAGVLVHKPFLEHTDDDLTYIFESNFRSAVWTMQRFIPDMLELGQGSIINVASISAVWPEVNAYYYGAMKSALKTLTTNVAKEFSRQGIRANCILPGPIETPLIPAEMASPEAQKALVDGACMVGRTGLPEDIAYGAVYLASDESAIMTGQYLVLDSGVTISNPF